MTYRDKADSVPRLTPKQARVLVQKVLKYDDAEGARALAALLCGIGYERDHTNRDGVTLFALTETYTLSMGFGRSLDGFVTEAATDAALLSDDRE
jgi:hypothetical protein